VSGLALLKAFELKYVLPLSHRKRCKTCGCIIRNRHLRVLASDEKEALLMRKYLLEEGFEG